VTGELELLTAIALKMVAVNSCETSVSLLKVLLLLLQRIVRVQGLGVDWIHLAEDRGRWRAVVNAVMNRTVLQKAGKFFTV
jgi:hypothetical protein